MAKHIVRTQHLYISKEHQLNMSDYILEYEHLYQKVIHHDIKLSGAILTFKSLDGAQVKDDERKLTLTMSSNLNLMKFLRDEISIETFICVTSNTSKP